MCNADKRSFAKEIKATQDTIKAMSTPVKFDKVNAFPKKLLAGLVAYTGQVSEATMGTMTSSEMSTSRQNLMTLKN